MFDYLICDYPLPASELQKTMKDPPTWNEIEFQTKNMNGAFDKYTIEEDGQLYLEKVDIEWEKNEDDGFIRKKTISNGIEKQDYTGELCFGGVHLDTNDDYFFEFKAFFWKGEFKEMHLDNWQKENNCERKKEQEKFKTLFEEADKKSKSFWRKLLYPFKVIVFFLNGLLRYFLGLIIKLSWKIDRWVS